MHRWVGLAMTVFLVVAGLTGSVLAFFADLDAALNPELFRVEPPHPRPAESTLDADERLAQTSVEFDGNDGRQFAFHAPTGESVPGSLDLGLIALHFGAIRELGIAYRSARESAG